MDFSKLSDNQLERLIENARDEQALRLGDQRTKKWKEINKSHPCVNVNYTSKEWITKNVEMCGVSIVEKEFFERTKIELDPSLRGIPFKILIGYTCFSVGGAYMNHKPDFGKISRPTGLNSRKILIPDLDCMLLDLDHAMDTYRNWIYMDDHLCMGTLDIDMMAMCPVLLSDNFPLGVPIKVVMVTEYFWKSTTIIKNGEDEYELDGNEGQFSLDTLQKLVFILRPQ